MHFIEKMKGVLEVFYGQDEHFIARLLNTDKINLILSHIRVKSDIGSILKISQIKDMKVS